MNNTFNQLLSRFWALMLIGSALLVFSCKPTDDTPADGPIASFQYEVDANDFLTVLFSNFSQNASTYSWEFGDGATSTEKDPSHTYAMAGSYTITLTAKNDAGDSKSFSETIDITDPNETLTTIAGDAGSTTGKVWYLQREGVAMGVGPTVGDVSWWAFGVNAPLATRPCVLDDAYTFYRDGKFENNTNGTFFKNTTGNGGWIVNGADEEGCYDETAAGVWGDNNDRGEFANGGAYTFSLDNAAGTLTLDGLGAYIALCDKTENGDNNIPVNSKTFQVTRMAKGSVADSMQLVLTDGANFAWHFNLVSYHTPADLPPIPTDIPVFGEDLPDNNPTELSHTFSAAGASVLLDTIPSGSTIEYGVDDPADPTATKLGSLTVLPSAIRSFSFRPPLPSMTLTLQE
ncbi:MAG: PKD domain-containing protein [Bacteroidia bacterium]